MSQWADEGLLRCFRLPGRNRRFRESDVRALLARMSSNDKAAS